MSKIVPDYFNQRIEDLQQYAEDKNLSEVIVYARGSATGPATKSHGYMRYLCNWNGNETDSILIISPNKKPILLVTGMFDIFFSERFYWMSDVRYVKINDLGSYVSSLIDVKGLNRIGIIGMDEIPVSVWLPLVSNIPKNSLLNIESYIDEKRIIKDDFQLSKHQAAAEICDMLFETLRAEIKNNKPGYQLQADLQKAARYAGAEYCSTWLTIAPQAEYCHMYPQEGRRIPQLGDQVLLGIFLLVDGYWGHAIRTGFLGKSTNSLQHLFHLASDMHSSMLEKLIDGSDLAQLHNLAENKIKDNFPDNHEDIYRFRHGHGLGHSYEEPITNQSFPQVNDPDSTPKKLLAKKGMLFELHPNLFVPNIGGAVIGDMIAVTSKGNKLLTNYPRHHINWSE